MPRKGRVILPGCPHHIVQRGHNKNTVFVEQRDYVYYLNTLKEFKADFGIKVYAYCLMTNHVHLVLEPCDREGIGLLMKRLAGRQTRFVNKLESRTGSLWEGRYKLSPIDSASYLLRCCRYVDLNPVKARMVDKGEDYEWSSYRTKLGLSQDGITDFDEFYLAPKSPCEAYRQFVEQGISSEEQRFLHQMVERNQLTGGRAFEEEVLQRTGLRIENRGRGRPSVTKDCSV